MAIRVCEIGFIVLVILQSIVAKSVDPTKLQVIPESWNPNYTKVKYSLIVLPYYLVKMNFFLILNWKETINSINKEKNVWLYFMGL